jgi:phosphatidylglycerophosphatase A
VNGRRGSESRRAPLRPRLLLDPVHFLALGAGSGLSPRAPGTAGSVLGALLGWPMLALPLGGRIAVVAFVVLAGVWICGASARKLDVHDHPGIVLDEIAGMLIGLLAAAEGSVLQVLLVFVFFRVFDIAKPWPIREIDHRLGGGLGIMLDDLVAGTLAALCLLLVRIAVPTI